MNVDKYQENCMRTWSVPNEESHQQMTHALLGLSAETGELVGSYDKAVYKPGHELDIPAMQKELGDVMYYVTVIAELLGIKMSRLIEQNAKKLEGGYGWVE